MRKERGGLCGIIKHVDQSFFKWASRGIKKPDSKPNLVHGPTLTPPCVGFSNPLTLSFLGPSTFEVSENSSKASPSHLVISSAAEDEPQVTHEPSAVLGQPVDPNGGHLWHLLWGAKPEPCVPIIGSKGCLSGHPRAFFSGSDDGSFGGDFDGGSP